MVEEFNPSEPKPKPASLCFFTLVGSIEDGRRLRLLMKSLRAFGGQFSQAPVWIFWSNDYDPKELPTEYPEKDGVAWIPLAQEDSLPECYFARKVLACAQAEEIAAASVRSLVWLDPNCLVIQPPALFDLNPAFEAAFRPVHIRNVGSLAAGPLDEYWGKIYHTVGMQEHPFTVRSFIDQQTLRPYFNTHLFSIDPSKGVLRAWLQTFKLLVADRKFQAGVGSSELHQIFLHQAILSTLVARLMPVEHIRILPPEYSYPLHLHFETPQARRSKRLNSLVVAVYEDETPHPDNLQEIEILEPLRSWLVKELPAVNRTETGRNVR
jgi:hypothetical protein